MFGQTYVSAQIKKEVENGKARNLIKKLLK